VRAVCRSGSGRGEAARCTAVVICFAALLAQASACSRGGPNREWAGAITDSAGVTIVSNPAVGLWSSTEAWTLEEDLRIGSFGGDLDYVFGQVGTIALNSLGEIFVSDRQAQEVRVFSPSGMYLRTIGRPGSGPGEMSLAVSDVLISPGDTLLVPDTRNRRISRYAPDGTSIGSTTLDLASERPLRYYLSSVGGMAVQLRPTADTLDAIRVVEPSGTFGDTLLLVPSGGLFQGGEIHYFTPEPMWAITDSLTVIYGVNAEYRIGFYGRDGALRHVVSRSFEPLPITDGDTRAIFGFLDRAWLDAGVPPSRLPENRSRVHFAEFFPAFSSFHIGVDGSLWVQPVQSPGDLSEDDMARYNFAEDFGASGWEVFDAEGRFLGIVEMPPRFQPRTFRDDMIYGVWRDDLDVQYVLRLRVVRD